MRWNRYARLSFGLYFLTSLATISTLVGAAETPTRERASAARDELAAEGPMAVWIQQYTADMRLLDRRYRVPLDAQAAKLREQCRRDWLKRLGETDFSALDRVGQTDYVLLKSEIQYQLDKRQLDEQRDAAAAKWLPYAASLIAFLKTREEVQPIAADQVAASLDRVAKDVEQLAVDVKPLSEHPGAQLAGENRGADESAIVQRRLDALRAGELIDALRQRLREAHGFYAGYDPQYSWWVAHPMQRLLKALESHRDALREKVVGLAKDDKDTIIGLPIGAAGLQLELRHEWIAHSPQELVELAEREMRWCDEQMAQASAALGFGDDWRKAMEHVKSRHVQPGEQPQMIRELAWEAIRFLEAHDLVTVPPLAASGWTMSMMSPEQQRVNPYFLGGDSIIVSFPTDAMTHEEKLMSMRSNNEHFSRATVHHELIPGHHLQYHMLPRYRPYRELFATPFWMEGWALYWEMLLWDLNFAQSAEDRVGMLFWRKHRCARIIFSLNYHLGRMTPEQCVDYLVERVGHERSAATAEVRRSIMGGYSPLYQAAYMLGGLQLRNLHEQLVQHGTWTNRQFHDAILHEHSIPIEVLRNFLTEQPLTPDMEPNWQFAGD